MINSKINLQYAVNIYNKVKKLAFKSYEKGEYIHALEHIEIAAEIAYKFNWIYTDSQLEELLLNISNKIITKKNIRPEEGRIVFYDVFCLENKGLTQQYIRALISWRVEILYIYEGVETNPLNKIIIELKKYSKARILTFNAEHSKIESINYIYNEIVKFKPEKAFLHLRPSSTLAVCLWNSLTNVTRYQVNLTDHAFWLGTSCINYSIEFRNYGYTVSKDKRGLKNEQLLIQPFYPIRNSESFKGFPPIVTNENIVVFTGGAYYKMYGENDAFFSIIKKIIDVDKRVIVLVAGGGDKKPLVDFIEKNKINDRVALIGARKDIDYVFKESDIYLSTFPITGGLMAQFAAANKKPILSYSAPNIQCNFIEGILNWNSKNWTVTFTDFESFLNEANKLILDEKYRNERGQEAYQHLINVEEFNNHLKKLTFSNQNIKPFQKVAIDYSKFTSIYIDCENNYTPSFFSLIISRYKLKAIYLFPNVLIKSLFTRQIYFKSFKKIFERIIK